jgi:hypothetical protein
MIEQSRRHGPFDPRFPRRPPRATSASSRAVGVTRKLVRVTGGAESSEDTQRDAGLVAALQTWEGEGGANERSVVTGSG